MSKLKKIADIGWKFGRNRETNQMLEQPGPIDLLGYPKDQWLNSSYPVHEETNYLISMGMLCIWQKGKIFSLHSNLCYNFQLTVLGKNSVNNEKK